VDGQVIAGGLLYVGSRARSGDGQTFEPALIDPSLPVQWRRPDLTGATMGYWPSYGALDPSARAGYLNWLLGGRSDPNAYIGFVFLYFYGFERRFLVDLGSNSNHPDAALITAEVLRLLAIYGDNGSFPDVRRSFPRADRDHFSNDGPSHPTCLGISATKLGDPAGRSGRPRPVRRR
jgi:hypothetical protein